MSSPTDLLRSALADLDLREAALQTTATDMEAECAQKLADADTKIAAERRALELDVQRAKHAKGKVEHDLSALRERVKLNVGGFKFVTTLNTLTKFPDTYFSAAFSGRHEVALDDEGYFCIDRDGTHFRCILNWLRDGTLRLPSIDSWDCEIRYYLLEDFLDPETRRGFTGVAQARAKAVAARALARAGGTTMPRATREQVVKLVQQGAKVFPTLDYSDLDLSKIRFVDGTDFRGAELRYVDLSDSVLTRANFSKAQLEGANLRGADLSQCKFGQHAKLAGADLSGANLGGSEWQSCADLRGALLTGAMLDRANMQSAQLLGADLEEASLVGADLSSANLTGANLRGCQLKGAKLKDTTLYGANLSAAQMQSASLVGAKLGPWDNPDQQQQQPVASACLSATDLSGADLTNAHLGRVDFAEARLVGAKISNADFSGANLYAADLTGVSFQSGRVYFKCANFTNAVMTLDQNAVDTQGAVGLPTPTGPFDRANLRLTLAIFFCRLRGFGFGGIRLPPPRRCRPRLLHGLSCVGRESGTEICEVDIAGYRYSTQSPGCGVVCG